MIKSSFHLYFRSSQFTSFYKELYTCCLAGSGASCYAWSKYHHDHVCAELQLRRFTCVPSPLVLRFAAFVHLLASFLFSPFFFLVLSPFVAAMCTTKFVEHVDLEFHGSYVGCCSIIPTILWLVSEYGGCPGQEVARAFLNPWRKI